MKCIRCYFLLFTPLFNRASLCFAFYFLPPHQILKLLRISFLIVMIWCGGLLVPGYAQSSLNDKKLLSDKIHHTDNNTVPLFNYQVGGVGSLLLTFYQRFISSQLMGECIYTLSCSRYSRMSLNKHGLFKGILMTGDRLTRCSGCSDYPSYKFNENGQIEDLP